MKSFFPLSARVTDVKSMLVSIALYIVLSIAVGFVLGLLTGLPVIGGAIGFVSSLVDLYCWGGMVVSIMFCFNVLK